MIKSYIVDSTFNNMRFDRWLRIKLGKVPQGLIEKNLRLGKSKIHKIKVKSSFKIKTNDRVDILNVSFGNLTCLCVLMLERVYIYIFTIFSVDRFFIDFLTFS